nr:unnamed protein product [Callosobruchus chinensis]
MSRSSRKRRRSPSPSSVSVSREGKNPVLEVLRRLERRMDVLEHNLKKRPRFLSETSHESSDSVSEEEPDVGDCSDAEKLEEHITDPAQPGDINSQASSSLHPEMLSIIGDEGGSSKDYGPPIQQDLATIWTTIATKGLDPEKRLGLLSKYPCPENGLVLRALKLNPVIKEATTEAVKTRDHRLSNLQAQIGSCLAAIGLVITNLLKEEGGGNKQHIEKLSDAGRLLSDLHNLETISRRNLVSMNLNKDLKETLLDSPIDEWLFGESLDERLKTAKSLQEPILSKTTCRSTAGWASPGSSQETDLQKNPAAIKTSGSGGPGEIQELVELPSALEVGSIAGRLRNFSPRWKKVTNSKQIFSWLKGYKIPFFSEPFQVVVPKEPKWSDKERKLISDEVAHLIQKGAISKVNPINGQFVSNTFTTPKRDGSLRLIINLKQLNAFIKTDHFKLEDHKTVARLITPGCFLAKVDLQDAYFLVPIHRHYRKYLRFRFANCLYEYNCLCFGINCAPRLFTKIIKPIVAYLRYKGHCSIVYLDDFLLLGKSYDDCLDNVLETIHLLQFLGFVINFNKSRLTPKNHPSPLIGQPFSNCRQVIREALLRGQVPNKSLEICMASISEATLKQYNCGLKLWWEFCSSRNINPFVVTVVNVLEFLSLQFNKGASYSSLNSYRSAIAQIAGPNLAQDFRMQRFFKGTYMLRPSLPKYEHTWDPCVVLNCLKQLKHAEISLEDLTHKCVTLLALATGQRLQTLALIEISNIHVSEDAIRITVPKRIRTSAKNKPQPMGTENSLFITVKKPFHKASTQTLSRWIKTILRKSGIDVNIFTGYSVKHAAVSAASRKGLNYDTIRRAAGWSSNSKMFTTVYNRPVISSKTFTEAVLIS